MSAGKRNKQEPLAYRAADYSSAKAGARLPLSSYRNVPQVLHLHLPAHSSVLAGTATPERRLRVYMWIIQVQQARIRLACRALFTLDYARGNHYPGRDVHKATGLQPHHAVVQQQVNLAVKDTEGHVRAPKSVWSNDMPYFPLHLDYRAPPIMVPSQRLTSAILTPRPRRRRRQRTPPTIQEDRVPDAV